MVLVIDARGMTRGIAPLILGYQAFDRDVRIAGVILNNLGGSRHEAKLRLVIEHYTDVPVLGAVHCDPRLAIVERHLGLMPSNEADGADATRRPRSARSIGRQVDLDGVLRARRRRARRWPRAGDAVAAPGAAAGRSRTCASASRRIARSASTMPDDLDALRAAGATLVGFDTLADAQLPNVDGLFIGGGFPEMFAAELEANAALRTRIRSRDRRRTAGLRRMRRAHVPRAHADAQGTDATGWSARFPATS